MSYFRFLKETLKKDVEDNVKFGNTNTQFVFYFYNHIYMRS